MSPLRSHGQHSPAPRRAATSPSQTSPSQTSLSPTSLVQTSLSRRLGLVGWSHLDPVLLAALATEAPVLLVGEHGTAKTYVAERVARALQTEFRHYNASLLNYDDLVGIPLPDEGGGLRFVGTAGAVWDAEFAFFDEVNRCRPDLQNKLFPIVHERRVAGHDLPRLRHRWAAMNPPSADEDTAGYLGAGQLDAALSDRFTFVVRVPGWADLSRDERLALAAGTAQPVGHNGTGAQGSDGGRWLADLVADASREFVATEHVLGPQLSWWAVTLADLLRGRGTPVSPRRARVLVRAAAATHAAATVLGHGGDLRDHLELVTRNALPCWADAEPPDLVAVVSAHTQAWEVALGSADRRMRRVLAEPDPVRRIGVALREGLSEPDLSRTVTAAIAAQPTRGRRAALGLVVSRALDTHALTPAAWGLVAQLAAPALKPGVTVDRVLPGPHLEQWRLLSAGLAGQTDDPDIRALASALVNGLGPAGMEPGDADLLTTFTRWCAEFGVTR